MIANKVFVCLTCNFPMRKITFVPLLAVHLNGHSLSGQQKKKPLAILLWPPRVPPLVPRLQK